MLILTLALIGGKLDDPAPAIPIAPIAVSHKLDDPAGWPPRVLPVAFRDDDLPLAKAPTPKPSNPTPKPSNPTPKVPAPAPADEWRTFAANPSYEVYGHIENGVFRYTQYRAKPAAFRAAPRYYAPVLQYGSPCANGACPR